MSMLPGTATGKGWDTGMTETSAAAAPPAAPPARFGGVRAWLPSLPVALLVCAAAAAIGGVATATGVSGWYPTLAKPPFTPPNALFGPVWTLLYALMGIALWLLWRAGGTSPANRPALALFAAQLALNAGWSVVFFGLRAPGLALLWIAALAVAIALTIGAAWHRSRPAAWLLTPYLLWVGFAGVLNAAIWWLNR